MPTIPPTTNLLAFEAVASRRSFSQAAIELNLTASAISHQVARLEAQLGVSLFNRNAHGVELSREGESYLSRISGAIGALTAASDDVRKGVGNSLYVHASPSFASLWLVPRIAAFAKAFPHITLNLTASTTHSDFTQGQVDIDIRYGRPHWPNLVVKSLFDDSILPLASPGLIRKHGLRRPEQLLEIPLIQSTMSIVQWSDWFAANTDCVAPERFPLRFDRAHTALDVAAHGLGVALDSSTIASMHISDGRLKPVFGTRKQTIRVQTHFVVYPAQHAERPAVQAFLKWLNKEAG